MEWEVIMIERLKNVEIEVKDIEEEKEIYRGKIGEKVKEKEDMKENGVKVVLIEVGNKKIEIMENMGEGQKIDEFIEKKNQGGMNNM